MIELLGSIGWGLLACGSITHIWHHRRLQDLLAMHFDNERPFAFALTAVEVALTIALPIAFITNHQSLGWLALAASVLALGFMVWIARLLITGSDLPCACSFSDTPTTIWSFARSLCVGLVACFALVTTAAIDGAGAAEQVATLAVGWGVAAAIFVLPEAVTWPTASKALMARVDAHVAGP